MKQQLGTGSAMLALGILLVSPVAWGCEGTSMQNCSLSDCPMTDQNAADGCHEADAMSGQVSSGCDAEPEVWIACCDAPVDPEPAKIDSSSFWEPSASPLIALAEKVAQRPPKGPPDFISQAISSRRHDLGRFTLLSSLLL